jgi:hypothetical protein
MTEFSRTAQCGSRNVSPPQAPALAAGAPLAYSAWRKFDIGSVKQIFVAE